MPARSHKHKNFGVKQTLAHSDAEEHAQKVGVVLYNQTMEHPLLIITEELKQDGQLSQVDIAEFLHACLSLSLEKLGGLCVEVKGKPEIATMFATNFLQKKEALLACDGDALEKIFEEEEAFLRRAEAISKNRDKFNGENTRF